MSSTEWIVVNYKIQPAVQECQRCGQTAPFPFNCSLNYVTDCLKLFIKHHRNCKPQEISLPKCQNCGVHFLFDRKGELCLTCQPAPEVNDQ